MKQVKLTDIETQAREFSKKSKFLRDLHEKLNNDIEAIKTKYIDNIKKASSEAGEAYQALLTLVQDASELFEERKTMSLSGVKFGYMKKKGRIEILNEEATIKKIKELYGDRADLYLKTKPYIIRKALDSLPASDLKKIGVNIVQDTAEAFVKLTDDEVQKLIEAMIKEAAKVAE